jgi:hypothetical protein
MSLFDMDRQFADVMTLAELFAAAPAGGPKA